MMFGFFSGRSLKNVPADPKNMLLVLCIADGTVFCFFFLCFFLQASMTGSERPNASCIKVIQSDLWEKLQYQNTCQIKGKSRYPVSRTALPTYLVVFPMIDSGNLPSSTIKKQKNAPR